WLSRCSWSPLCDGEEVAVFVGELVGVAVGGWGVPVTAVAAGGLRHVVRIRGALRDRGAEAVANRRVRELVLQRDERLVDLADDAGQRGLAGLVASGELLAELHQVAGEVGGIEEG